MVGKTKISGYQEMLIIIQDAGSCMENKEGIDTVN
jgi:hypothetical protein